jgi:orotidine-5'-phosphate decarboxylase
MALKLNGHVAGFKIGLELVNAAGFDVFDRLREAVGDDIKIFYDCKFHDIPNTVAGASRAAARRGLWMFNIHASGGPEMMKASVAAAREAAPGNPPLVIAVTVLTSIDQRNLTDALGVNRSVGDHVVSLARMAQDCGCDGVVASPHEVAAIRQACGDGFLLVVPGVRPVGADIGDQKRVMTPREAVAAGADYLVIGRPITGAPDPLAACEAINADLISG